jgi:putative efflux protein, MATE family
MLADIINDHTFNQKFNKDLFTLVVPIALQNLISAAVISADVIILGMINQSAMAAVSLAGQVTFVLTLFYYGLATGVGIQTAQYWGKKDIKAIQYIVNIAIVFSAIISVLFFLLSLSIPEVLMRIFTNDNELIRYGTIFLRTASISYLATGLSQVYLSAIKSMEKARISATFSSIALILTIALDTLVVLVLFPGQPEKAVLGVAISTVIARFVELGLCFIYSRRNKCIAIHLPGPNYIEKSLFKDYVKYTLPVQANYLVWGGALTATATIIGHVNADMVAANSITSAIRNLAIVLCGGISSGGAVLIGKYLGKNDQVLARKAGNRLNIYALLFGVIAGITILLFKPLLLNFVNLSTSAHSYLNGMLIISAYYCVGKSINSTNIGGIFPAGGDPEFGFWTDTIVMWGIVLPLSYLSAFVWHFQPILIYAIISLDEVIKIPVSIIRFRQYKWVKNITRELVPEK